MNRNFPQDTPYPEIFFSKHSSPSIILYDLLICCGFPLLSQLPTCPSTSKMLTKQGTREYYLSGLLANIPRAFRTMPGMWWSLRKYWLDDCMQPKSHVILLAHVSQQPELFFDITFGPVKSSPKPEIMQSSFSFLFPLSSSTLIVHNPLAPRPAALFLEIALISHLLPPFPYRLPNIPSTTIFRPWHNVENQGQD